MADPSEPRQGWHPAAKGAAWVSICAAAVGGFEGCYTYAYKDPVGIPTICFGATSGVHIGDVKTKEECNALLMTDLYKHKAYLDRPSCVGSEVMDTLNPKVEAALVSITYNMGPGKKGVKDGPCELKFSGKPSTMIRLIKEGKIEEACMEFPKWANPPLPGIIKRRNVEMKMCLEGAREMQSVGESS